MDIVPDLLDSIQKDYKLGVKRSIEIRKIKKKIADGSATYIDADDYAKEVAGILARSYEANITPEILPDGKMYYNIAKRILEPTLKAAYKEVSETTTEIQALLNQKAGIGLKAIKPSFNMDRLEGLINRIVSEDKYVE